MRNSAKIEFNVSYAFQTPDLTDNDIDRLCGRSSARSRVRHRDRMCVALSPKLAIQIARLDHSRWSITIKLWLRRQDVESRVR